MIDDSATRTSREVNATPLCSGDKLGPYEIVESLGKGGMGYVYRARDPRLGRMVAVKVITPDRLSDPAAKSRFVQEARASAGLRHSNIVAVFDVGWHNGIDYLVMECVDGTPLSEIISARKLKSDEALEYAAQIAAGLAAAHGAGIIHRDIKPANVIITPESMAKILDFGLAKLDSRDDGETRTLDGVALTQPGVIAGTVAYMSPEQAEGHPLDRRTDIFSAGLILYEMLSGTRAFGGNSAVAIMHSIIHDEVPRLSRPGSTIPGELDEILSKALAKNPRERYQHAGDMEIDLRRLQHGWKAKTLPSMQSGFAPSPRRAVSVGWAVAVVALIALIAVWIAWRAAAGHSNPTSGSLQNVRLTPFTTDPGYEGEPTLSSDGQTVAFVSDREGRLDIFVRQISGGALINLTHGQGDNIQPSYSPDGRQLAFVSSRGGKEIFYNGGVAGMLGGEIWVMPALGGAARRIAGDGNYPSWSPDGTQIFYVSGAWFRKAIYRVPAGGGEPQRVAIEFGHTQAAPRQWIRPSLSRNGGWLAFAGDRNVYVAPAAGGMARVLLGGNYPTWSPDGKNLVFTSGEDGRNDSLSILAFSTARGEADGPARPLTVWVAAGIFHP